MKFLARWAALSGAVTGLAAAGCNFERIGSVFTGPREQRVEIRAEPVSTRDVAWRGWSAIEQSNGLITLRHVPDAGGRTLSLEIGGDDAFLVMPQQAGNRYPADSRDTGVHFGGHYIAIGPERIWNVNEQPFNPHSGPFQVVGRTPSRDQHELRLVSRPDTWKGATIAAARTITVRRGTTHVTLDEQLTNRGPGPLDFYLWDFTQLDGVNRRLPQRQLRNISVYVPVPPSPPGTRRKLYHVFPTTQSRPAEQFDERLPGDVLAIHYRGIEFKIASQAVDWWVAAVDHDTGWTYVKSFEPQPGARYVDGNGPVEVYGSTRDPAGGMAFLELELLTGFVRKASGESIEQREHWYATICKGPVLAVTPAGLVCEPLKATRDGNYFDVSGRFGVFHQGSARLNLLDEAGAVLFAGEPEIIDPRQEFRVAMTLPAEAGAHRIVLVVHDYRGKSAGELASVEARETSAE